METGWKNHGGEFKQNTNRLKKGIKKGDGGGAKVFVHRRIGIFPGLLLLGERDFVVPYSIVQAVREGCGCGG